MAGDGSAADVDGAVAKAKAMPTAAAKRPAWQRHGLPFDNTCMAANNELECARARATRALAKLIERRWLAWESGEWENS